VISKNIYRFIKYKEHRKKVFRELKIKPFQDRLLKESYSQDLKKLIVFLIPGADRKTGKETMSGGVISIVSICEETKKIFKDDKSTGVVLCTMNDDYLLTRYENFDNESDIFRFEQLSTYFKNLDELIIHIPDFLTMIFYSGLRSEDKSFFTQVPVVHFNIMNQNIRLMPAPEKIEELKALAQHTTITTAHQQYSTKQYRDFFKVPLHKLSVWVSPEQYKFKQWEEKENLLIYSPDPHPEKDRIIKKLASINGLQLQMISGLTYNQFKEVISRAKWALTFGEGLDGYFLEPVFSGAVGFAVYNKEFFTPAFSEIRTVYSSYQVLYDSIVVDIENLDEQRGFSSLQDTQYKLCESLYSSAVYRENIQKFYRKQYTFA
jgi:hypothetical protein